ncbi:MAG: TIGR00282 family metallophosphoesterase [Pseudobdellovibrionaceae bacterium]|jgi:metallophosphoesterase (TIGR00282 family)|nr:TIGR00282 family metallophosphoesterase [Pseudobdellovibrionaceae bacterium]
MKIVFIGDVVARAGRDALAKYLPEVRKELNPDVVIVNGENAAHGIGINEKICKEFFDLGVDVITLGNHAWDQREVIPYIEREQRLVRPLNYPAQTPGKGSYIHTLRDGRKIMVINAMARLFMDPLDDPFAQVEQLVSSHRMGKTLHAIFLDFHGEATSEKMAMGHFMDGKISAVVGTHTHIPTADAQILPKGTAMQCDAGMTGDYNSVIGMNTSTPIMRFTRKFSIEKLSPAEGEGTMCGTYIETDDATGLAKEIRAIRRGPRLSNQ